VSGPYALKDGDDVSVYARTETTRRVGLVTKNSVGYGELSIEIVLDDLVGMLPRFSPLTRVGNLTRDEWEAFKRLADRAWDEYEKRFGSPQPPPVPYPPEARLEAGAYWVRCVRVGDHGGELKLLEYDGHDRWFAFGDAYAVRDATRSFDVVARVRQPEAPR
jgi:hypothetical protein